MKKIFLLCFVFINVFFLPAFAEETTPLINEKTLIALAEQGQAEAQFNLGMFYQSHQQFDQALHWYLLSANQGFTKAQINLGLMYQQGIGVELDEKQMLHWMKIAAESGDPIGQMNMAEYTLYGINDLLEKNPEEAERWLKKAAEQHFQPAMLTLAYWYEEGKAITKDPQKAQKIYLALAEENHPQALYLLGYQAAVGMYDKVNYPLAFQYFTRAAELGFSPPKTVYVCCT
ncbi:sel1 repeat family protein [Providencia rettgeri]|nr:sel1 repeat family protein [Providencia rettgeri]